MIAACPFPANHGTPGSIREMAESLAKLDHEVHIVTYHYGEAIDVDGPSLHRISPLTRESKVVVGPTIRRPLYDLQLVFKAIEITRRYDVDVIHAHGYEAALAAGLCRLVTGVPFVYSAHNTMSDELPTYDFIRPAFVARGLARLLDWFVPRLAARCLPHSENIKTFLIENGLAECTDDVVNFGIEIPEEDESQSRSIRDEYQLGDDPVVIYTGVMDRFQRIDLLLDAMVTITRQIPKARLCMVQTVPNDHQLQSLQKRAEQLGLSHSVLFTPPQTLEGVRRFLAESDVAVVPRPEAPGFPIKLLNYMAAGKPSVLFRSSASGLQHAENAYLVDQDTSSALADAIVDLLSNQSLRKHIGRQGRKFVEAHHDRRQVARKIVETWQRTVGGQTA
jgi:glycosyltransferase involved in cell wall biosynthesis